MRYQWGGGRAVRSRRIACVRLHRGSPATRWLSPVPALPSNVVPCPACQGSGELPEALGRGWAPGELVVVRRKGLCDECDGSRFVLAGQA